MTEERETLRRRALKLEYATVSWNVAEAVLAIVAGVAAGSIALLGFGLDSVIEVIAAVALIWRLNKGIEEEPAAEKKALQIVGWTFLLLAVYVGFESARNLWTHEIPHESRAGIALTLLSSIIMPALGLAKRKVARQLGSRALEADAMESMICSYLSVIVLAGLALNAALGWWWADPAAGLVMVAFLVKEGREALEAARTGKHCCGC